MGYMVREGLVRFFCCCSRDGRDVQSTQMEAYLEGQNEICTVLSISCLLIRKLNQEFSSSLLTY